MRRHVYYYTHLDLPPEAATVLLTSDPAAWLPEPAELQGNGTWLVDLSAEGALPKAIAHHRVAVDVGPVIGADDRCMRQVTWRSATVPGVFPVFDGDLELVALSGGMCQLSLIGTYRPPLAVAGTAADALLGHHVAEACVRRFVLDAAERMAAVTLAG